MRSLRVTVAALSIVPMLASSGSASRPVAPLVLVTSVAAPGAVSGRVVFEGGRARWFYLASAAGLVIYDISDPAHPRESGRLSAPNWENEDLDGDGEIALVADDLPVRAASPAGGVVRVISTKDRSLPQPVAVAQLTDGAGHTASCVDRCRTVFVSGGASLGVIDLADRAHPAVSKLALPVATGAVHDGDQDGDGVLWLSGESGLVALATRRITGLGARVARISAAATSAHPVVLTSTGKPNTTAAVNVGTLHNSRRPLDVDYRGFGRGGILLASEESTAEDCRDGGRFHTFDARGLRTGTPLRLLDSVAPEEQTSAVVPAGLGHGCSAHWFSTRGALVAVAWYGAGLRLLDASDPRRIRQVGAYVPADPRTWSAYWIAGTDYVYALDLHRGLDVLRVNARPGAPQVGTLDHGVRPALSLQQRVLRGLCR